MGRERKRFKIHAFMATGGGHAGGWFLVASCLLFVTFVGCAGTPRNVATARTQPAAEQASESASASAPARKGRTRLWAENCMRCHNARPPTYYSMRQWEVAMHHMRVRGALTAHETEEITEFFRSTK